MNRVRGELRPNAKLNAAAVATIRTQYAAGKTMHDLAVEYGVALSLIHGVVHGRRWSHVGAAA